MSVGMGGANSAQSHEAGFCEILENPGLAEQTNQSGCRHAKRHLARAPPVFIWGCYLASSVQEEMQRKVELSSDLPEKIKKEEQCLARSRCVSHHYWLLCL